MTTLLLILALAPCSGCGGDAQARALHQVGSNWLAAWNQRQPEDLLALFDEDVTYWPAGTKQPLRGKLAVRQQIERVWQTWGDMEWIENAVFVDPANNKVAVDWSVAFRTTLGKPVQIWGVDVLHVEKSKIVFDRSVYNVCDLLAQANAPAPRATPTTVAAP